MEPFGHRIATIRKELGLSQRALATRIGTNQPRIARIERGEHPASVAVINKLSAALHRVPADLVTGTDREAHYFAEGLAPDQLAEIERARRDRRAVAALMLLGVYDRIVAMFAALHAGPYVVVRVSGEEMYLSLRELYDTVANDVADAPSVFFPDHFEILSDDEALDGEFVDEELARSQLELRKFVHGFNIESDVRLAIEKMQDETFATFDENTEKMRQVQIAESKRWIERLKQMKKEGLFDNLFGGQGKTP